MLSVKQVGIKYPFKVFGMTQSGIERRSPGPLVNTLPTGAVMYENTWYLINVEKKQNSRNGYTKNVNINLQCSWFHNLEA